MTEQSRAEAIKKRIYRKRLGILTIVNKIKLWPSRNGCLHGIRQVKVTGDTATLITHCNKELHVRNSVNSRAGRWLRNRWYSQACPECRIPEWKLEKYSSTRFKRHHGSLLLEADPRQQKVENVLREPH